MDDTDIEIIITCRGRLQHLKRTLPIALTTDFGQKHRVLVVAYGDPEAANWAASAGAWSVLVEDDVKYFNTGRARNCGAQSTPARVLCFVDADIMLTDDWARGSLERLNAGAVLSRFKLGRSGECFGTCMVKRGSWMSVRGYDEYLPGWGSEDTDFYNRLSRTGAVRDDIALSTVDVIHHDDRERVENFMHKGLPAKGRIRPDPNNVRRISNSRRPVNPVGFGKFQGRVLVPG